MGEAPWPGQCQGAGTIICVPTPFDIMISPFPLLGVTAALQSISVPYYYLCKLITDEYLTSGPIVL